VDINTITITESVDGRTVPSDIYTSCTRIYDNVIKVLYVKANLMRDCPQLWEF